MNEPVDLLCALIGASCVKFDSEGSSTIRLTLDASQKQSVMQLLSFAPDTVLRISVREEAT